MIHEIFSVRPIPLGLSGVLNSLGLGWGRVWWVLWLRVWNHGFIIWAWHYRTHQLFKSVRHRKKGHGRIFEWKMHSFHWCWNLISSPKPLFHLSIEEGNLFLKNCIFIIPLISTPLLSQLSNLSCQTDTECVHLSFKLLK